MRIVVGDRRASAVERSIVAERDAARFARDSSAIALRLRKAVIEIVAAKSGGKQYSHSLGGKKERRYGSKENYVCKYRNLEMQIRKNHTVFVQGHANKFTCAECERDKRTSGVSGNIEHRSANPFIENLTVIETRGRSSRWFVVRLLRSRSYVDLIVRDNIWKSTSLTSHSHYQDLWSQVWKTSHMMNEIPISGYVCFTWRLFRSVRDIKSLSLVATCSQVASLFDEIKRMIATVVFTNQNTIWRQTESTVSQFAFAEAETFLPDKIVLSVSSPNINAVSIIAQWSRNSEIYISLEYVVRRSIFLFARANAPDPDLFVTFNNDD